MEDRLNIGGVSLESRLFIGTGKYADEALIPAVVRASGAQVITVAMRRVEKGGQGILANIPQGMRLLPNTAGARSAEEAVRLARLARAAGCGDWIKIEVIDDPRHLLPNGQATVRATEILAGEGFTVLPYINPDLYVARDCASAGASAIMPLGSPIGSNRGLRMKEMIAILIAEMDLPVIVDAGLGLPSHACEAMELGAAACLVNTAIARAERPELMAAGFRRGVEAGRLAWLAGSAPMRQRAGGAEPSSPQGGLPGRPA